MAMGLWAWNLLAKSSRLRNWATVKRLVSAITSVRLNLPNHSLCQTARVRSLSTTLKNWRIYDSAFSTTSSCVSMGLVMDWPLGSPIWAVQSPTMRITWCPRSWSCRSLRRPTTCPRWMSGRLGSNPIFRRRGRPASSSLTNSAWEMISLTPRRVIRVRVLWSMLSHPWPWRSPELGAPMGSSKPSSTDLASSTSSFICSTRTRRPGSPARP